MSSEGYTKELLTPSKAKDDRISWYERFYRSHSGAPRDFLSKLDNQDLEQPFEFKGKTGFATTRGLIESRNSVRRVAEFVSTRLKGKTEPASAGGATRTSLGWAALRPYLHALRQWHSSEHSRFQASRPRAMR